MAEPVTAELLRSWPLPGPGGDKNERGTALVVGGARQNPGAVLLAAEAALRCGAGKVQVATADVTASALAAALPEAYIEALPVSPRGELLPSGADRVLELASGADAVLLGPGLSQPSSSAALLERIVPELDTTVVLDALGTAYLTGNLDGVRHLRGRVLLTPNTMELAATLELDEGHVADDPLAATAVLARKTGAVVLSGSATSYIVLPTGRAWSNRAGSPQLATAGSGDVKAGAIVGLSARGAAPEQAAVWAAHCHGLAGERLAARRPGFLARDLLVELPSVLSEIGAR